MVRHSLAFYLCNNLRLKVRITQGNAKYLYGLPGVMFISLEETGRLLTVHQAYQLCYRIYSVRRKEKS